MKSRTNSYGFIVWGKRKMSNRKKMLISFLIAVLLYLVCALLQAVERYHEGAQRIEQQIDQRI
jgi:low affinity Fe/Cu permease